MAGEYSLYKKKKERNQCICLYMKKTPQVENGD